MVLNPSMYISLSMMLFRQTKDTYACLDACVFRMIDGLIDSFSFFAERPQRHVFISQKIDTYDW